MEKLKTKFINIKSNRALVSICYSSLFIIAVILKITGLTFVSTFPWWLIFSPLFLMILGNIIKELEIEVSLEEESDEEDDNKNNNK